jgi:hypothetical protein
LGSGHTTVATDADALAFFKKKLTLPKDLPHFIN